MREDMGQMAGPDIMKSLTNCEVNDIEIYKI